MAVMTSALQTVSPNRRRRVRHKIQTPAYATFTGESQGAMLDLHEIVDISEDGVAIQCHSPLELEKRVNLCLDLADCAEHIYTTGQVVWSNASGRAGLRFSDLSSESVARLREWLFVNVMAGVANGDAEVAAFIGPRDATPPRPNYTDTLAAVTAVQRQVEALGSDLAACPAVDCRARTNSASRFWRCHRAGGRRSGFHDLSRQFRSRCSARRRTPAGGFRFFRRVREERRAAALRRLRSRCARGSRKLPRPGHSFHSRGACACRRKVDRNSRSFLRRSRIDFPHADGGVLQRLAETVLAAVNRAARAEDLPPVGTNPPPFNLLRTGKRALCLRRLVKRKKMDGSEEKISGGISLPRSHLIILICAADCDLLCPWLRPRSLDSEQAAGSRPQRSCRPCWHRLVRRSRRIVAAVAPAVETASFDQLHQMAEKGDPAAQNALGLRYATGEGVKLDEREAVRWFIKAAEQGNVAAQSKLGSLYFSGRGVPQDSTQAYFWMVVARLSGDDASETLATICSRAPDPRPGHLHRTGSRSLAAPTPAAAKPPAGH